MIGGGVILRALRLVRQVIGRIQGGAYRDWEDKSFRYGMIWFIASR